MEWTGRRRIVRASIERWLAEGLVDRATADRLIAHEDGRGRRTWPVAEMAGAMALALGIVALVSANWDQLPVWSKLGGHVALNLALGAALWPGRSGGGRGVRAQDVLVPVLAVSTLALIAHVGQSFNLQGSVAGLLGAWMLLVTPLLFTLGRNWTDRWLWSAGLWAAVAANVAEHAQTLLDHHGLSASVAVVLVAGYAAPLLLRGRAGWAAWGAHLHALMAGMVVLGTSAAQALWRLDAGDVPADIVLDLTVGTTVATLGLAAVHLARAHTGVPRWGEAAFFVASPAYAVLPVLAGGADSPAVGSVGLCLYWGVIAVLGRTYERFWLYRLAVGVIALRLVVTLLEAFGGLLMTGVGLVAAGLGLLAVGYAARRLMALTTPRRAPGGAR